MNTPTTFNFDGYPIRTVDIDGDPWFVAKDVALALGLYINAAGEVNTTCFLRNISALNKTLYPIQGVSRRSRWGSEHTSVQAVWVVSERGLYKAVMRSDKEQAKKFQDWVAGVIVEIRKTGKYEAPAKQVELPATQTPAEPVLVETLPALKSDPTELRQVLEIARMFAEALDLPVTRFLVANVIKKHTGYDPIDYLGLKPTDIERLDRQAA